MQLHADARPAAGVGAMIAQRSANPAIGGVRECLYLLDPLRTGVGAPLAQRQQLVHEVLGLVGERSGDRALGERSHIVTAGVDHLYDLVPLEYGCDDAGSQLVEPDVDTVALLDRERADGL